MPKHENLSVFLMVLGVVTAVAFGLWAEHILPKDATCEWYVGGAPTGNLEACSSELEGYRQLGLFMAAPLMILAILVLGSESGGLVELICVPLTTFGIAAIVSLYVNLAISSLTGVFVPDLPAKLPLAPHAVGGAVHALAIFAGAAGIAWLKDGDWPVALIAGIALFGLGVFLASRLERPQEYWVSYVILAAVTICASALASRRR